MNLTLDRMARLLIGLSYYEGDVFEALRAEYPSHTVEEVLAAIRAAQSQVALNDAALRAEVEAQAALAFAAEHDLTKSMHRR